MMAKNDSDPSDLRKFAPFLAPEERDQLHGLLNFAGPTPAGFAESLRRLARSYIDDGDSAKLRAICLLVADLLEQGWRVSFESEGLHFKPPGIATGSGQSVEDVKGRIRTALQAARRRQLAEPSVRAFIARMERRTLRAPGVRSSILDLIDDGAALADDLAAIAALPEADRDMALAGLVDPVVEICHSGTRCPDTGLPLNDIWRYFRHTWAHEYRPIPGRQLLVLVRNAARPNRPVMGIAMLASPVMRVSVRDNWIGWLREAAEANLREGRWRPDRLARAMTDRIESSIGAVRWDDLARPDEIEAPVDSTVLRLEQKAAGAAFARDLELRAHYQANVEAGGRVKPMRGAVKVAGAGTDWRTASEDLLFVRKRAELLAQLLFAKQVFRAADLEGDPAAALDQLLSAKTGQRAIDIVLTEFRKAGLSSRVADVSICGAVAPYNELLGGKLVALLLASSEVHEHYARRYGGQVSVIASQMAGRAISKPADLRVLTTTSLYGVGSSQYNRLTLRASEHKGLEVDIRWDSIGQSKTGGFGTLHLGADTAHALRQMAQNLHTSRRVNNRFGEGTSPRLRQIREGLDALGIASDSVLHHATPRLFYACELGGDARASLLGMAGEEARPSPAAAIAQAWRRRWLDGRSQRLETLDAMRAQGPESVSRSLLDQPRGDLLANLEG
ncbi:Druantia anti-phage system protein DruA [Sphingomonas pseudosanguinis]|uniref:Druantia anti-phage system protein DruA n=1 Tax=Sphingomonas pseudosanguinis TaxID=413712 RepID=UPI003F825B74